ncbi:hypothetical protein NP233_g9219 [Leucocoprinus birnbaumii]|uniref:F-box domain-containing protein n=1 Tax=Leucocoprinus birnbaumii TaxID=56174 RepID=A0AAD5YT39_9AGAR|nr:hypothetical protein NP233_g9219 [Leucocoprinus birnbaumii]
MNQISQHTMLLPQELLDNVFSHLPTNDLLACTRSSSSLAHIAQRHIFRNIDLGATTKNPLIVPLLARNPHLARCVRSFQIRLEPRSPVFRSFYDALATALANMTGLTSLQLYLRPCSSSVLRKAIFNPDVLYPRLREFSCSLPFDSNVVAFLSKTPNLDSLSLDHIPTPDDSPLTPCIPPTVMPHLTQFAGPQHAALALVPGRSLVSIQLHDGDLTEEIVEGLAGATSSLLVFSASTSSPPLPILRSIGSSMRKLMYLRLMSTQNFLDVPDRVGFAGNIAPSSSTDVSFPTQIFFHEVADVLYDILDLTAFELCGMHWNSSTKKISENEERRIWTTPYEITFPTPTNSTEFDDSEPFFAY